MKFKKEMLRLYAVTDRQACRGRQLYELVESALRGGVTIVQLREKSMDEDELVIEAQRLLPLCHSYGAPLIINDNYQAAIKSGADGVHVGLEDTPVSEIRRIAGADFIIGATAKTIAQAQAAQSAGADYLGVGAVFPSPTKANAVRITPQQLKEITQSAAIPCTAIGGITIENADELAHCGAEGIAVVSSLFSADDVEAAAKELRTAADRISANSR